MASREHTQYLIRVRGLSVGYGTRPVVSNVSVQLQAGKSLLIAGHNGSGKTTLLRTLFGLLPPLSGEIEVVGGAPPLFPSKLIRAGARFLGQGNRGFAEFSVRRSRHLLGTLYGQDDHSAAIGANGIDGRGKVGRLSYGQRRFEALRLLAGGFPKIYFLDEPLAGIDSRYQEQFCEWMKGEQTKGVSFVIVEQKFRSLLPLTDTALIVRAGAVSYCGPSDELVDEKKLACYFL